MITTQPVGKKRSPVRRGKRDKVLSCLLSDVGGRALLAQVMVANYRTLTPLDAVCPPGSLLDIAVTTVRDETDLPPETALAVTLALLGGGLAMTGSTVAWAGERDRIELALWLVLLAPSAAGKTFVTGVIKEALGLTLRELPEPGSGRAFLDGLAGCKGRAVWLRDEYGQLMRQIADGGPFAPLRDYLLRAHDHGTLESNTIGRGKVAVEHPVLGILGSSVDTTWGSCVDAAMLADGLLARHLFIVAMSRPLSVPLFPRTKMIDQIAAAVSPGLRSRLSQRKEYVISDDAQAYYTREWKRLAEQVGSLIDAAYVRRVTWATARLATIYHLLLDEPGEVIGVEAMQWAWRLTQYLLAQVRAALDLSDPGVSAKLIRAAEWAISALQSGKVTPETLQNALLRRFSRDLTTVSEARYVIDAARNIAVSERESVGTSLHALQP